MVIENPNSSGQGYDPEHAEHPLHDTVIKYGYEYSHSTRIRALDGTIYSHHTYKLGTHNVGLSHGRLWDTSVSTGSGHKWDGLGAIELDAHLKSKRRRYGLYK